MYYLIKENSTLIGGFPAFVFKPIPGVKMLHSMPWNLFGGIQLIAGAEVDIKALIESADKKVRRYGTRSENLRSVFYAFTRPDRGIWSQTRRNRLPKTQDTIHASS